MGAPRNPNPGPGARARRAIGDRTAANRLTTAGWTCVPPTTGAVSLRCGRCGETLADEMALASAIAAITDHRCQEENRDG